MMFEVKHACGIALLTLVNLVIIVPCTAQYIPPTPIIKALHPRGVHFSIPDEPGISLVAYHAKFNEDFNGLEAGTIARDIVRVKNGRWIYEDHTTRLKLGDTIYLWVHVIFDGLGYNLLDQVHRVTNFYNYDGTPYLTGQPVTPPPPTISTTTTENSVPFCYPSTTSYNGQNPCIGQLLFSEEFNQIDTSKWRIVKQFPGSPDYEFVVYQGNERNLKVENGELHIKPTLLESEHDENFIRNGNLILQDCTGQVGSEECEKNAQGFRILPPVSSGMIDTKKSCNFLYGRIEIRAKLPQGDWLYPIIKLSPVENTYGSQYQSGELRIADVIGNRDLHDTTGMTWDGRILRAGAVVSPEGPIRANTMSRKSSSTYWSDDWHVYELQWTPTTISVKVDGNKFDEKENPAAIHRMIIFGPGSPDRWSSPNSPFDKLFYLSIGVGVGGLGQFPDRCISGTHIKPWRNVESKGLLNFYNAKNAWASTWTDEASTLKVDYVKIWAL